MKSKHFKGQLEWWSFSAPSSVKTGQPDCSPPGVPTDLKGGPPEHASGPDWELLRPERAEGWLSFSLPEINQEGLTTWK